MIDDFRDMIITKAKNVAMSIKIFAYCPFWLSKFQWQAQ